MKAKTIGIISIKGGVGKTSSTVALGAALADSGKKVLLIDGNFTSPHLGFHVGLYNPELTLHHVLDGKTNIKDAIHETQFGFDLLPGALIYGKINAYKLMEKMREIKKSYDVILIDSSPNLNEEMRATMIASDELLVMTTPDYVTLGTTLRAIKLAKDKKTPITGLVLNKVYNKKFEIKIKDIENAAGVKVLAVLPHELSVVEALSKAVPSTMNKNTESSREYRKLAAALMGEEYKVGGIKSFFNALFGRVPTQEVNRVLLQQERLNQI